MRTGVRYAVFGVRLLLLACAVTASAGDVRMHVTADRERVFLGESFVLSIRVSGVPHPPGPDVSALVSAEVLDLAGRDETRRSVTIIDGRLEPTIYVGYTFRYRVTPSEPGPFRAGPVTLPVGPRSVTREGPTIMVEGMDPQDLVRVTVSPSRTTLAVGEPFDVTLSLFVRRLPGDSAHRDPFDPKAPPSLSVPYLRGRLAPGLRGTPPRELLRPHLARRLEDTGVSVNDIDLHHSSLRISGKAGLSKAKFRLPRRAARRAHGEVFEYSLKARYVAESTGRFTFGPVLFKGLVVTNIRAGAILQATPVFTAGAAPTVMVLPPPVQNRPDSFIGVVASSLSAAASLDAATCRVGEPLRLTVEIAGEITGGSLRPPAVGAQPEASRDFRIYDGMVRSSTDQAGKRYEYVVRPLRSGSLEFPPIDISYYDIEQRAYLTIRTDPIPLAVRDARQVAPVEMAARVEERTDAAPMRMAPGRLRPLLTGRRTRAAPAEARFLWDRATSLTSAARTADEFAAAAEAYNDMIAAGHSGGALFYNQGTALLKSRRWEEARVAFRRAERHLGRDPDLLHNMRIASDELGAESGREGLRMALYWHFALPAGTRRAVAATALCAVLAGLGLFVLGYGRPGRRLACVAAVVLALFGTSVAVTAYLEARDTRETAAGIIQTPGAGTGNRAAGGSRSPAEGAPDV